MIVFMATFTTVIWLIAFLQRLIERQLDINLTRRTRIQQWLALNQSYFSFGNYLLSFYVILELKFLF